MTILPFLLLAASLAGQAPPAAPARASAPDWQPLGTSRGGFVVSWDSGRIERDGDSVHFRLRTELPAPAPGTVAYAISRIEIRCADGLGHVVETVNYLTDGTRGRTDTEAGPLEAIPAGSMLAAVQRAVC